MLHALELQKPEKFHRKFEKAFTQYPEQTFVLNYTEVNQVIKADETLQHVCDAHLTKSQVWEGEKKKAARPQDFTFAIVAAKVLPGTYKKTAYGEVFDRISIQPTWLTGKLVVVKERTHIDELQQKVVFIGITVDIQEAKDHLIEALLDEHFISGSQKTVKHGLFADQNREEATQYLEREFENLFCREEQPLFHVEHGVTGEEQNPIETWKLVRLTPSFQNETEENAAINLRNHIENGPNTKMYAQIIKELNNKKRLDI